MTLNELQEKLNSAFHEVIVSCQLHHEQLLLVIQPNSLFSIAKALRDEYGFEQLIDIAGIDYAAYGQSEWETEATTTGFSRGVEYRPIKPSLNTRFAVAYQLLSYQHNLRLNLKIFLHSEWPEAQSLISIWPAADWFEREAFDLFGIIFRNHPDLRRILTDYGFIGHPFRKDFPLIGQVEVRYDAEQNRVIYGAVEIAPRTLVPRVIRNDSRYLED